MSFGGNSSFGTQAINDPFYSTKTMIDAILYATGHGSPSSETKKRIAILQFINNTYQEVHTGYFWRWTKSVIDFNLEAPYSTGTVSVTNGLDTVTGVGTAFSAVMAPKAMFHLQPSDVIYRTGSVDGMTSLTLETAFSEDSATDSEFEILFPVYKLPKEVDQILSITVNGGFKVDVIGYEDLRALQVQNPTQTGIPRVAALSHREADDDNVYLEFFPAPDKTYSCTLDYMLRIIKLTDSTDSLPVIPDRYRTVLYYGALAQFYRFQEKMALSEQAQSDFGRMWNMLRSDKQLIDQELVMIPARDHKRRHWGMRKLSYSIEDFGRLD